MNPDDVKFFEVRYDEAQYAFNQAATKENGEALDRARRAMQNARRIAFDQIREGNRNLSVHSMPLPLASFGDSESSDLQGDSAEDSR